MKGQCIVAVIPARGGSKGLPGKNIRMLQGKPLIAYTIEAANATPSLARIILTTDSPQIAEIGKRWGLDAPFVRPAELARDTTHTPPVIEHAVRYLETQERMTVDLVVTLQPTSPFRTAAHVTAAIEQLVTHPELDSVVSVTQVAFPPCWMLRLEGERLVPLIRDGVDYSLKERQELPVLYQPNGAVYVTRRALLKERGLLFSAFGGGATGAVVMDARSSLDIDNELDFAMAKAVLVVQEGSTTRSK